MAAVVQLVERGIVIPQVVGSSPTCRPSLKLKGTYYDSKRCRWILEQG